jgi:UDP-glucose 4-epimerase
MTARKVLLTGGAGFIGGHVAEAYVARGDRVWILDDLSTGKLSNVPVGVELVEMGVADEGLDDLFRKTGGFDVVNHHAAQIDVRISVADPRRDARTNVDGLLNLLECARRHAVGRVVFVSSGGVVYGEPEDRPTPETAPKMPLSPYGCSKLAGEYYLHYYHRVHGLDYVALRYGNVYGPRQDPHGEAGVVAIFSNRILAGHALTIYGDGEQTRDYVFVGDVVAANLLLTDAALPAATRPDDRAFNIGTGKEASVVELASELMQAAGSEVEVRHAEERVGELRHSCLDITRAASIGWTPATTIGDGLTRTYNYIAAQGVAS